jgi:subtilisin family serine protease
MNRWIIKRINFALLSCALLLGPAVTDGFGQTAISDTPAARVTSPGGYAALQSKAEKQGKVRTLVRVRAASAASSVLSQAQELELRANISNAQSAVIAGLAAAGQETVTTHKYEYVPYLAMTVDRAALAALAASSNVVSIEEDIPVPAIADSWNMTLIGATALHTADVDGTGVTVAVLDTGVEKTHPYLLGAVVSEACYSTNDTANSSASVCPGGVKSSTAKGSAMPYAGSCPTGSCDHGTHVAGIIAGREEVEGSPGAGVAPGANIIAIQIFSRFDDAATCGGSASCVLSWTSDQIKGLERVYALRKAYKIASVNMSLGGGAYSADCDGDSRKSIIDRLRTAGIATVIASGNSGYCGSISAPGCISSAVSVGAVTSADAVAYYSNSASFVSLLAPGSAITSSVPGGGYASWNGTSMATPHVAGSWALIRQGRPNASVNDILSSFQTSGASVTDTKAGCTSITKQRINVGEAYDSFVTASIAGNKKGTVTSDPAGLACDSKTNTCTGLFSLGSTVTLTGTAATGSFFDGWTNCPSTGSDGSCQVTVGPGATLTAAFNPPPKLAPSPASVNFGTVASTGPYTAKTITVKNTGASHLTITSASVSTTEFGITADTCASEILEKGATCAINVAPTGFSSYGAKTATLSIVSTDPKSPATAKLQANAGAPRISAPGSLGFGTVTKDSRYDKTITVKNTGASILTFTGVTLRNGSAALSVDSSRCVSLAKNAACPIFVSYTPTDTSSVKDYIDIATTDPGKGTTTVTVTGKGK